MLISLRIGIFRILDAQAVALAEVDVGNQITLLSLDKTGCNEAVFVNCEIGDGTPRLCWYTILVLIHIRDLVPAQTREFLVHAHPLAVEVEGLLDCQEIIASLLKSAIILIIQNLHRFWLNWRNCDAPFIAFLFLGAFFPIQRPRLTLACPFRSLKFHGTDGLVVVGARDLAASIKHPRLHIDQRTLPPQRNLRIQKRLVPQRLQKLGFYY